MRSCQSPRQTLRRQIRESRRALPAAAQQAAAVAVCERIAALPWFQSAEHIALFIAADGEVDLTAVQQLAEAQGKHCYLPAISRLDPERLCFRRYCSGDPLAPTPLGVMEPAASATECPLKALDLVLTPLVAFDEALNRMGMGKGFYDKTFAFKRDLAASSRPRLVGIAHECQRVDRLETAWWDVPLDAVITPAQLYRLEAAAIDEHSSPGPAPE